MKTIAILMLLASPALAAEPSPSPVLAPAPIPAPPPAPCGPDGMPTDPTQPCTLVVNPLQALNARVTRDEQTLQAVLQWINQQQLKPAEGKVKKP